MSVVIVAKFFVINACLVSALGHVDLAGILNRIFVYWQPNDIYVILNSTISTTGESVIGAMVYPRYVSVRGDFFSFIQPKPIRSVFPDNFVLIIFTDDSCQNLMPILRDQLSQEIIVKRSKIVVVALHTMEGMASCMEGIFRKLWKIGFLNVFVLNGVFVFGFNPFSNDFLLRYNATDSLGTVLQDRATNLYGTQLKIPHIDVYPGQQSIIWRNKSMKIGTYHYIQQPLAKFFNASLCIYTPQVVDFGFEFFLNATTSVIHPGIGYEVAKGIGDLTIISRSYATSNFFDYLSPLHLSECNLLTPKTGRVPQYTIMVEIASSWVGLSSILTLAAIVAFTAVMKKVLRIKLNIASFCFELASVFLGQSFRFPIRTLSMKFTIACWLLTCILLGTFFNAKIVMAFLTPMYIEDVNNPFDAIRGSDANVYTFDDFVYYLRGNSKKLFASNEMFQLLLKRLKGVTPDKFYKRVLHPNGRDMFMVISMADNLLEKTKYLTEQTYSYHKTYPFFISLTANIVPRGSIIYNHYNDFNYRVFEAGLLLHWKNLELLYEVKFGSSSNEAQENSLSAEDLCSAFLVLVFGYAFALTAFAVEKWHGKVLRACCAIDGAVY